MYSIPHNPLEQVYMVAVLYQTLHFHWKGVASQTNIYYHFALVSSKHEQKNLFSNKCSGKIFHDFLTC